MKNWIWVLPEVSGGLRFDETTVRFLLELGCVLLGLFICFGGRKSLNACIVTAVGLLAGYGGVLLSGYFPESLVLKLVFFSMFCFFGLCLAFFLDSLWKAVTRGIGAIGWFGDRFFWLTAFLGAGITAATVWERIYRDEFAAMGLFSGLSLLGLVWQISHRERRMTARTYDDLYRMGKAGEQGDGH